MHTITPRKKQKIEGEQTLAQLLKKKRDALGMTRGKYIAIATALDPDDMSDDSKRIADANWRYPEVPVDEDQNDEDTANKPDEPGNV